MIDETNVQLTDDNEAAEPAQTQNQTSGEQTQSQQEQKPAKTYTEAELQSEADRRVTKALETFKTKELPGLIKSAQTEAEKLAKMTADEKAKHEREKAEAEYNERLQKLTRGELRLEAHKTLTERHSGRRLKRQLTKD